jgi:hypothetical protein
MPRFQQIRPLTRVSLSGVGASFRDGGPRRTATPSDLPVSPVWERAKLPRSGPSSNHSRSKYLKRLVPQEIVDLPTRSLRIISRIVHACPLLSLMGAHRLGARSFAPAGLQDFAEDDCFEPPCPRDLADASAQRHICHRRRPSGTAADRSQEALVDRLPARGTPRRSVTRPAAYFCVDWRGSESRPPDRRQTARSFASADDRPLRPPGR